MKCILGKKLGMVQLFDVEGRVYPATVIHCEPNRVIQVKDKAVKVGFDSIEAKKLNKAQLGVFKKVKSDKNYKYLHEFVNVTGYKVGDELTVNQFKPGEYVDIQGTTKGRGFTGAIKRWNFKIGPMSHGAGYPHRYQGSIAMGRGGSQAQRVRKGQRMSGHYGTELVTIQNLLVLYVNERDNTITVMGAIPGASEGVVFIKNAVKKTKVNKPIEFVTQANLEEVKQENAALQDKEAVKEANAEIDKQEAAKAEAEKKAKEAAAVAKAEEEKAAAKAQAEVQAQAAAAGKDATKAQTATPAAEPKKEAK